MARSRQCPMFSILVRLIRPLEDKSFSYTKRLTRFARMVLACRETARGREWRVLQHQSLPGGCDQPHRLCTLFSILVRLLWERLEHTLYVLLFSFAAGVVSFLFFAFSWCCYLHFGWAGYWSFRQGPHHGLFSVRHSWVGLVVDCLGFMPKWAWLFCTCC